MASQTSDYDYTILSFIALIILAIISSIALSYFFTYLFLAAIFIIGLIFGAFV